MACRIFVRQAIALYGLVIQPYFAYNPTVDNIMQSDEYRKLPSVDEMLRDERVTGLLDIFSRKLITESIREALDDARAQIAAGGEAPGSDALLLSIREKVERRSRMSLRRAINATGIIIHTGLGRSVLGEEAQKAVAEVAGGHSTLEIDVESGKRGSRQEHISPLLTEITGAGKAMAVNNNAAAVLLAINTLAMGREVIISRGQLVEIGGSFRLPDIIERAGARLVEVGTTNRTRIADYERAINENTALILRCHPSNFKISGFTEESALEELVALGERFNIPVMDDLGSGAFVDISQYGLEYEPTVQDSVRAGADIICFSGDKLLGASQAGILVGSGSIIDACRSNPLARVVRVDKLTLAALEATLRIYLTSDPVKNIPTLAAIARPLGEIESQAGALARNIDDIGVDGLRCSVETVASETGGGSMPGQSLESRAVTLMSSRHSAEYLSEHFRENHPPIFGRIAKDTFFLDMRTVRPQELEEILACVRRLKA